MTALQEKSGISARTRAHVPWPLVTFVGVFGLGLLRLIIAGSALDRVWAEDGGVFYSDVVKHGVGSIDRVYASYASVVPRLLAAVGTALPEKAFAVFAVLVSLFVTALLAAFIQRTAFTVTGSLPRSLVAAFALALTPALRGEALGDLANLQWFFVVAAAWAMTANSKPAPVVAFLAAITTPLVVLVVPVAWVTHRRRLMRTPSAIALFAGLVVQVLLIAAAPSEKNPAPRHPGVHIRIAKSLLTDTFGPSAGPTAIAAIAGLVVLALAAILFFRAGRQPLGWAFLVSAALIFAVTSLAEGGTPTRYSAVTFMLVISAFVVMVTVMDVVSWALVGLLAVEVIGAFRVPDVRVSGRSWTAQVSKCVPGTTTITVSPGVWYLRAPC